MFTGLIWLFCVKLIYLMCSPVPPALTWVATDSRKYKFSRPKSWYHGWLNKLGHFTKKMIKWDPLKIYCWHRAIFNGNCQFKLKSFIPCSL